MDLGIRGKVALVAAASQGMGRAAAFALAREGCKVALCARNEGPLQATVKAVRKETGAEVLGITADVARAEDVATAMIAALQRDEPGVHTHTYPEIMALATTAH